MLKKGQQLLSNILQKMWFFVEGGTYLLFARPVFVRGYVVYCIYVVYVVYLKTMYLFVQVQT